MLKVVKLILIVFSLLLYTKTRSEMYNLYFLSIFPVCVFACLKINLLPSFRYCVVTAKNVINIPVVTIEDKQQNSNVIAPKLNITSNEICFSEKTEEYNTLDDFARLMHMMA